MRCGVVCRCPLQTQACWGQCHYPTVPSSGGADAPSIFSNAMCGVRSGGLLADLDSCQSVDAISLGPCPVPPGCCRVFLQEGAWRVGEGVCCLTTPSHTYIARVKPLSGDLVMLFSIPQPDPGAQQGAVPVAAWLPHNRWACMRIAARANIDNVHWAFSWPDRQPPSWPGRHALVECCSCGSSRWLTVNESTRPWCRTAC